MIVRELRGYKSLRALNAYSALILGMKMLPAYMGQSYEEFLAMVEAMPEKDQRRLFKEGASFVELSKEELEAIGAFVEDVNGVPYSAENIKNLKPTELVNMIVEVAMAMVAIKVDFVSNAEKKN